MLLSHIKGVSYDSPFWDSPYSIFVAVGFFILLFVGASIYNKIKHPKKKKISLEVKVESVRRVRTQMNHGSVVGDGMINGGTAIPGSLFNVTFLDEENNRTFTFAISESASNKLKIGEKGILCCNGDEYISFTSNAPKEKKEKPESPSKPGLGWKSIVKLGFPCIIVLVCIGVGLKIYSSMNTDENETEIIVKEKENDVLTVYAAANGFHIGREDELYTTDYLLGEFPEVAERWSEAGYIYYSGIEKYKKETDMDVRIEFFNDSLSMLEKANKEWKSGEGPDVILGSYTSAGYSLYPYIEEGMFADLMPYFESDEIYSRGEYLTTVLEAGLLNNHQVIFPMTFNMNVLYTSEERMKEVDIWLSEDMYYDDFVSSFMNGWQEPTNQNSYLMLQFTNMDNNYPYVLFQAASGEKILDYETGKITLNKDAFTEWLNIYQGFVCNDYAMTEEELKASQKSGDSSRYDQLRRGFGAEYINDLFGVLLPKVFCFAEGGNCSYSAHSFVANTRYYESRFSEFDEEFICLGIPVKSNPEGYAAQITNFGVVLSNSEKQREGYELIKCLVDTKHWMHLDLSVNRQVIDDTLDELNTSYYDFYSQIGTPAAVGLGVSELLPPVRLQPMSDETKDYMNYLVDHIETANLPEFELYLIVTEEIEDYIWGSTESVDAAYNKVINRFTDLGYIE